MDLTDGIVWKELALHLRDARVLAGIAIGLAAFGMVWCQIFARAGFRPLTGLVMLVPGVNVVALAFFAFAPWPLRREVRELRRMQRSVQRASERHQRKAQTAA